MPGQEPLWTVEDACAVFARAGVPIAPDRLRLILRGLQWSPAGRAPSRGEQGGVGAALYRSSDLQKLHAAIAPFLRGLRAASRATFRAYRPPPRDTPARECWRTA